MDMPNQGMNRVLQRRPIQSDPRHGQLRQRDLRRSGGRGLERPLRLQILPPVVPVQPRRRCRVREAVSRQRGKRRRLAIRAEARHRPLPQRRCAKILPGRRRLHVLVYDLGNFLRRLELPTRVKHCMLKTLRDKLIKIEAKIVRHARYVTFQLAEVAIPRGLYRAIPPAHTSVRRHRPEGRATTTRRILHITLCFFRHGWASILRGDIFDIMLRKVTAR